MNGDSVYNHLRARPPPTLFLPVPGPVATLEMSRRFEVKKKYVLAGLVALAFVILDQITKIWVVKNIRYQVEEIPVFDTSWLSFSLVHAQNRGAAFGVMSGQITFFIVFTILAVGLLVFMLREVPDEDRFQATAIGLIMSGALGNLIDRIDKGSVTDFLRFFTNHPTLKGWLIKSPLGSNEWPSFNVADAAIVVGLGMFAIHYLFLEKDQPSPSVEPPGEPLDGSPQKS